MAVELKKLECPGYHYQKVNNVTICQFV